MRKTIIPRIILYSGKLLIKLLCFSCKWKVEGLEEFQQFAKQQPCMLMLWHNRLPLVAEILTKLTPKLHYAAVISNSRDAEPLALLANGYPNGTAIRVPHKSRFEALQTMIREAKKGERILIITPDGPQGPRYKVKPGIAITAKQSGAAIIPFSWESSRLWKLSSWDRMRFPKPFSTLTIRFGTPIQLEHDGKAPSGEELDKLNRSIQ